MPVFKSSRRTEIAIFQKSKCMLSNCFQELLSSPWSCGTAEHNLENLRQSFNTAKSQGSWVCVPWDIVVTKKSLHFPNACVKSPRIIKWFERPCIWEWQTEKAYADRILTNLLVRWSALSLDWVGTSYNHVRILLINHVWCLVSPFQRVRKRLSVT